MNIKTKIAIKKISSYLMNFLVPTHKNRVFAAFLENAPSDCYDLLNCGSSNMFSVLNYFVRQFHSTTIELYLEYYDDNRLEDYKEICKLAKRNNVIIRFIKGNRADKSIKGRIREIRNDLYRFSSAVWLNESGGTTFYGRHSNQRIVCFNYFISCKEDYQVGLERKWQFLDYLTTTALLPSQIISASNGVFLGNCHITGFPRNDTLLSSDKKEVVMKWITKTAGFVPDHVLVYAPTYRDYEMDSKDERPLFGYEFDEIDEILLKTRTVIVYKLHPYHRVKISTKSSAVIKYHSSYEYSLYDFLAISNALITDYSSLSFDYLLTDKPIIYNLYDLEKYEHSRGLSYSPFSEFCAGIIVKNKDEIKEAILSVISHKDSFAEKRELIRKLIHRWYDSNSTIRSYEDVREFLKKNIDINW